MSKQQAIELAKTPEKWQAQFAHVRGITFCKKMLAAKVGDELARRVGRTIVNPRGYRWWIVGNYSRPGGGGYICLRSDGKLVRLEQSTNLTKEFLKTDLGYLCQLVEECGEGT